MALEQLTTTSAPVLDGVLDAAAEATRAETLAAARRFELAAAWAEAHPAPVEDLVDEIVDEAGVLIMYGDQPLTIAGEGAPQMAEFAVAEFAAACGLSTFQGRALIGSAVEAKHRLPDIYVRTISGQVPVWKVRRVTDRTHRLTAAAAAQVDAELAPILGSCSFAQIERAVEAAAAEADPEHAEDTRLEPHNAPHVQVRFHDAHLYGGRVPFFGLLDYPDALAFEATVQAKAGELADEHPDLTLDERRALALGRLTPTTGTGAASPTKEIVVYAHYTPEDRHGIVDVERLGATTLEQVAEWCTQSATKITVRPVLDLDLEIGTETYRPTPRQRDQAVLTCPTCVFPGCGRHARGCDLDHIIPFDPDNPDGGKTTSWNLAPLCRLHHRLKTLGFWTYRRLTRTSLEWTSPSGRTYLVDHTHQRRRTR
ncbi:MULTISPECIES: HNH endonuclease signature motif containing protein [unclassified Nocardioides]|uniref:HNH endonuclease signature motif containing protein n=1 Tax=unclassified Nocardioides TaxID=2615069 RepID=UPI00360CBF15